MNDSASQIELMIKEENTISNIHRAANMQLDTVATFLSALSRRNSLAREMALRLNNLDETTREYVMMQFEAYNEDLKNIIGI